jgi:hypothetical protein
LARMADFARVGAMGMELAHEISQPLSTERRTCMPRGGYCSPALPASRLWMR